jgi:hypothetical protein
MHCSCLQQKQVSATTGNLAKNKKAGGASAINQSNQLQATTRIYH